MILALLGPWALAADPEVDEELIVYGELLVEQAIQELVTDLRDLGYTELRDRGDHLVLRHPAAWKGEVRIYDDGWVDMRRQAPRLEAPDIPWIPDGSPLEWTACVLQPTACVRLGGWTVSKRKFDAQQARVLAPMEEDVATLGDRVADLAVERKTADLPDRLQALWDEGTPLDGGAPLATPEERRAAILAYWDSRTDTPWGDRVREAVEAFVRAEVQTSDHPFSAEEIASFNAGRASARELVVTR